MPYYFYLARCADDSLYSGSCIDLSMREAKHNEGKGAKYTRSRRPIKIIYHEEFALLVEARRREAQVKTWYKAEKENLAFGKQSIFQRTEDGMCRSLLHSCHARSAVPRKSGRR